MAKKKLEKKSNSISKFFQSKKIVTGIGTLAIISGLFFIGQGSITGNTIVKENVTNPSLSLSIVGLLLIACSIILFYYALSIDKNN